MIDQQTFDLFVAKFEAIEHRLTEIHRELKTDMSERMNKLEDRVQVLERFRWMIAGAVSLLSVLVSIFGVYLFGGSR